MQELLGFEKELVINGNNGNAHVLQTIISTPSIEIIEARVQGEQPLTRNSVILTKQSVVVTPANARKMAEFLNIIADEIENTKDGEEDLSADKSETSSAPMEIVE